MLLQIHIYLDYLGIHVYRQTDLQSYAQIHILCCSKKEMIYEGLAETTSR